MDDLASLLWVVNLGCIDLNPWYARCDDADRPDYLHFDLDPVPGADFRRVLETACLLKEALDGLKMPSYPKTTGSRGVHVYVPIRRGPTQKQVWTFAKDFARQMEARKPRLVTAEYRKVKRPRGRVLVDYNQNAWGRIRLSPATERLRDAKRWLRAGGGALDGVIAKRNDLPYRSGDRTGMQKIKFLRAADCVVGGFRYASKGKVVGSLLLGLYAPGGALDHVGFCSGLTAAHRGDLTPRLEKLVKPPGFTGRAPAGPSRWSTERTGEWEPLDPRLVVEVQYDHFSQGRFRHGTRFLRWRPDKAPRQCTLAQVRQESGVSPLSLVGV